MIKAPWLLCRDGWRQARPWTMEEARGWLGLDDGDGDGDGDVDGGDADGDGDADGEELVTAGVYEPPF
jgi:hypothetical protein